MLLLGTGCISVSAIVFGILCVRMIRSRRLLDFHSRENSEKPTAYQFHNIQNTNQSAAIHLSTRTMPIVFDSTFKIHPHHPFSTKHILQL